MDQVSGVTQQQAYEQERAKVNDLFAAACNGDLEEFQRCVGDHGEEVLGYRDGNKRNVLHFACSLGHLEIVQKVVDLVGNGKDEEELVGHLQGEDANGDSPIRLAVRMGHVDIARYLVSQGVHVSEDENGENMEESKVGKNFAKATLLHEAVSSDNTETVNLVLNEFGMSEDVNRRSKVGTPLFWASFNCNEDIAAILLDAGADPNVRDNDGLSPLLIATTRDAGKVVTVLLKHGANLDVCTEHEGDTTVLHAGASLGSINAVKAILKHTPEAAKLALEKRSSYEELTPIELAAYSGHSEIAGTLAKFMELSASDLDEIIAKMKALETEEKAKETAAFEQVKVDCEKYKDKGNELFKLKQVDDAIEQYSKAIATAEKFVQKYTKLNELRHTDDRDACLTHVKEIILTPLLCNRSASYLKAHEKDAIQNAQRDAKRATEISPKFPKAFYRLGVAYTALEDHAQAAQAFWTGYELDPKAVGASALFTMFQKAVKIAKEGEQQHQEQETAPPPPPPTLQQQQQHSAAYEFNLPVEIPVDSSPNAPLRSLTLSFNADEAPSAVAGRFIHQNELDPSLIPRVAHHVNSYLQQL